MKYKFQIGDLVTFQIPYTNHLDGSIPPYKTGMITFRDKAGYSITRDDKEKRVRNSYYHILLPSGETHYLQREDRLALVAKANP